MQTATETMTTLFGTSVIFAPETSLAIRHPSVSPSVRQNRTDGWTDGPQRVGEDLRAIVPALVAQIVLDPVREIAPVERYGRVIVARVIPVARVDPILPLIAGVHSTPYLYWYQRYWNVLARHLAGGMFTRRPLQRMKARLLHAAAALLDAREFAYFSVWLEHSHLGDYTYSIGD